MDAHGLAEADAFGFIQRRPCGAATTACKRSAEDVIAGDGVTSTPVHAPVDGLTPWPTTWMLIDGNSLTYRAFFALPTDMATASGQVTNAVFGFTSMLMNLMRDHQPDRVVVAFDRPEPTFRHEQVETYKAQRDETPDILVSRWVWCAWSSRRSGWRWWRWWGSRRTT